MDYLPAAAHSAGGRGVVAGMGVPGVGMGAGAEARVFWTMHLSADGAEQLARRGAVV